MKISHRELCRRIKWRDNGSGSLDLRDLGITEIEKIPEDITHLDVSNNALRELPELSKNIRKVNVSGNNLDVRYANYHNLKYGSTTTFIGLENEDE